MILIPGPFSIEHELDPSTMVRTGRIRRRQFYAIPGLLNDHRPLSQRTPVEFRMPKSSTSS